MAAARRKKAEEEERERVRGNILSFLDSPNKNLQESLDQTVAGIILSPRQSDRSRQYIPDTSDPSRLAVRSAVRAFLENKDVDVDTVAHRLAASQLEPQHDMPPVRPPWDDIEERVNSRLNALISATHRDLVREKQRLQNEALMRETLDVSEHARQVRETKEAFSRYLAETQELADVQAKMDALDENIKNLEVSIAELQAEQKHKSDILQSLKEDDAEAQRLVARMWELDGEERSAKLGMRGELSEEEATELVQLRQSVGKNLKEKENARYSALKDANNNLSDLGHRIGFSQRELAANKIARSALLDRRNLLKKSLIELANAPGPKGEKEKAKGARGG
eukprot:CAMPEP_0173439324 /NCGR_PEP_ID=MMETSP1357-20121228/20891_1 /TAXON_ID=77926 /ORGANISM="Hemiselmis rufescens, Strain PCC563" /LENGTH=337 /DNA_ID=CAMNT_0014404683 /DNA_START=110 /DNA_END=1119 /DNA_ORIENTATION=+